MLFKDRKNIFVKCHFVSYCMQSNYHWITLNLKKTFKPADYQERSYNIRCTHIVSSVIYARLSTMDIKQCKSLRLFSMCVMPVWSTFILNLSLTVQFHFFSARMSDFAIQYLLAATTALFNFCMHVQAPAALGKGQ